MTVSFSFDNDTTMMIITTISQNTFLCWNTKRFHIFFSYILFICNCEFFVEGTNLYIFTAATLDDDPINIHNSVLSTCLRKLRKESFAFLKDLKGSSSLYAYASCVPSLLPLQSIHSFFLSLFFGMIYGTFQADHQHYDRHHHSHDDGRRCCGCCLHHQ